MQLTINKEQQALLHARKFTMYLGIAGMVMLFAALTSAYLVRRSAGNWLEFGLPSVFYISTIVIVLSSLTMHGSVRAYKKGNERGYISLLGTTVILAIAFLVFQFQGWMELNEIGVYLQTNPSASFLFVITGLHAAHVVGGVAALIVAMIKAAKLKFRVTPKRLNGLQITAIYWHFVDVLWIYLIIFFVLQ
ncbi:MAG: cytochrome c oxidase subunit 3 [Bacteroidota bacterium]